MNQLQQIESKEEKINRLRNERELAIKIKHANSFKYQLDDSNSLFIEKYAHPDFNYVIHVEMRVKVEKSDLTWRKGIVKYIKLENNEPIFGVMCGTKIFEKKMFEVVHNDKLEQMAQWENVEIPKELTLMSTERLLKKFRQIKKAIRNTEKETQFRAELAKREHVGETNKKAQKIKRKKK